MSYARCHGNSEFYAFMDGKTGLLQVFFSNKILSHSCGVLLTKEQAEHLKEICEKYLADIKKVV